VVQGHDLTETAVSIVAGDFSKSSDVDTTCFFNCRSWRNNWKNTRRRGRRRGRWQRNYTVKLINNRNMAENLNKIPDLDSEIYRISVKYLA
jgi:hypothetical protein